MKVHDIEPKHISGFGNVFVRNDFAKNIELPCLEVCLYFYDLNIRTMACNCHKEDSNVYLWFDADSLDDENKRIAEGLLQEGIITLSSYDNWYGICFNASLDDDVKKISNRLLSVAKMFQYQDVVSSDWKMTKTQYLEKIKSRLRYEEKYKMLCDEYGIGHYVIIDGKDFYFEEADYMVLEENGTFNKFYDKLMLLLESKYQEKIEEGLVDAERQLVFINKELLRKHYEYLDSQKRKGEK